MKRYSSGMYMRLAFSVAAHLEPEILLVDEVLAVGDAAFQKKCLGKMEELSGTGRTVLFVSHSMPSVLRLCPRVILLDGGHVTVDGNASRVVEEYMGRGGGAADREWPDPTTAPGDERVRLKGVRVVDEKGESTPEIDIRDPVFVEVEYWNLSDDPDFRPPANIHFYGDQGVCLFVTHDATNQAWSRSPRRAGLVRARCRRSRQSACRGRHLRPRLGDSWNPNETHAWVSDAASFQVVDPSEGDSVRGDYAGDYEGVMRPMLDWDVAEIPGHLPAGEGRT